MKTKSILLALSFVLALGIVTIPTQALANPAMECKTKAKNIVTSPAAGPVNNGGSSSNALERVWP